VTVHKRETARALCRAGHCPTLSQHGIDTFLAEFAREVWRGRGNRKHYALIKTAAGTGITTPANFARSKDKPGY